METVIEKIFEACVRYDAKLAPFYYDCDEIFEQESLDGLQIKKNASLKTVDKLHRVNLMNYIAQKNGLNVRYSNVGELILVKASDEKVPEFFDTLDCVKIIENNLTRAASFVSPPCYYTRNEFIDQFTYDRYGRRCCNVVLEHLDQLPEAERTWIIGFYQSLLPKYTIRLEGNILYII